MKDHSLFAGRFALNRVAVAAACAVLSALPVASWALGLGKLNVQSSLGEALRAEIDVTSITPEEAASLQAKVASPDTYHAAGVDYSQTLTATSIVLQRRADGHPYLKIASDRVVQEPFVDVILDLAWSSGRLVREYTLLLDPPASRAPAVDAPARAATAALAQTLAPPPAPAPAPAQPPPAPAPSRPVPTETQEAAPVPAPAPTVAAAKAPAPDNAVQTVRVKRGDSLSAIAGRTRQDGVSLDQMLVGLYRQNPDAFMGENMNRLKSGVVLNLPDADTSKSVSPEEAHKVILAQSADFEAYRQRLAGVVASNGAGAPQHEAKGKVEAEVSDQKQAVAAAPDKLTLSKGGVGAASAPAAEDRLAKSRAKADSATRVAELSKNLDDLRKLKDQAGVASAPAEQASAAGLMASAASAAAEAPAAVPSAAASGSATMAADSAPVAASATASSASAILPESGLDSDEPGFLETLNPMLLAAGGAAVALLAGLAMFVRARRRSDSGETSFLESRLQPDSFFGASGGQRVDTRDASGTPSSMSYSLSQLDAIGDVDPVAEADVYLAYGRDLQAEEILKEALRSTPDRLAVRTKLLEVYAKRRDTKGYEQLATQLHGLTHGVGEDWAKAQEMGRGIDPENPLYQPGGQPAAAPVGAASEPENLGASTVPHSVMPSPSQLDSVPPTLSPSDHPDDQLDADLLNLDLDISSPMRLDEAGTGTPHAQAVSESLPELPTLDGPLDHGQGLDFDLSSVEEPMPAAPVAEPTFDMSSISLDLDSPDLTPAHQSDAPLPELTSAEPKADELKAEHQEVPADDPMARKFDLAEEFRQIGDLDGAHELLQEVLDNTPEGPLRTKAKAMLDRLS